MSERSAFIARMATRIRTGHAGAGPIVWDSGEDISDVVLAACDRAAPRPTSSRSLGREYDWAALEESSNLVEAYAAVWGPVRERDEKGRWVWRSLSPDSFRNIDPADVLLRTDHEGPILGEFLEINADDYGLRTLAAFNDTPAAQRALADIRAGRIACYSVKVGITDSDTRSETRSGEPVVDITAARLLDAGPATVDPRTGIGPADTRARILAVGGVPVEERSPLDDSDLMTELEHVTGKSRARLMLDASIERHARQRRVDDAVRCIENALRAHRHAWERHASAVRQRALGLSYAPSFDEIAALADEVDEPAEYLRQRLTDDMYRQLVPRKTDLARALLVGAGERARRRW